MTQAVIIKPIIRDRFNQFMKQGRVLFINGPCGFGKTTVATALVKEYHVLTLSGLDGTLNLPGNMRGHEILLIDDLQNVDDESLWRDLLTLIQSCPQAHFILVSRGALPSLLMPMLLDGSLIRITQDDLLFDHECTQQLLMAHGLGISDAELDMLKQFSGGVPLGSALVAKNMTQGQPITKELIGKCYQDAYHYYETAVYQRFDLPIRRFLLELTPFDRFDATMARMVTGNPRAPELVDWLLTHSSMLQHDDIGYFHIWPQFRTFLYWIMDKTMTQEKKNSILIRGGMYYEMNEDYPHALQCYTDAGDHARVSEILIRNADRHPGQGYYREMQRYYRSLPKEEVLASPALMQGMSMLEALDQNYEGSEQWYRALKDYIDARDSQDAAGKQARSRLAWLDISLPQRDVRTLTSTFPEVFELMMRRELSLPAFSVTSNLPSVMNGGKDFSPWTKDDNELYKSLQVPIETVLGREGVAISDCALAESKFEKGEDISKRMLALSTRFAEIRQQGTPDIEFAASALFCRNQLATGHPTDARRTLEALRERFDSEGWVRFLPNMDALNCRIDLHCGNMDAVEAWYLSKAPRDTLRIYGSKRYQYLTQAMAELALDKPEVALFTLAPLEGFFKRCSRHLDGIHLHVLRAIAQYRLKDSAWKDSLQEALLVAEEYQYIRPICMYGPSILPLLESYVWEGDQRWFRHLVAAARKDASYYPRHLLPQSPIQGALTTTELHILRLICADKSNAQICETMNIKLPTVKTHVSHIFNKLGVSRRSEAKTVARKLGLISEH